MSRTRVLSPKTHRVILISACHELISVCHELISMCHDLTWPLNVTNSCPLSHIIESYSFLCVTNSFLLVTNSNCPTPTRVISPKTHRVILICACHELISMCHDLTWPLNVANACPPSQNSFWLRRWPRLSSTMCHNLDDLPEDHNLTFVCHEP